MQPIMNRTRNAVLDDVGICSRAGLVRTYPPRSQRGVLLTIVIALLYCLVWKKEARFPIDRVGKSGFADMCVLTLASVVAWRYARNVLPDYLLPTTRSVAGVGVTIPYFCSWTVPSPGFLIWCSTSSLAVIISQACSNGRGWWGEFGTLMAESRYRRSDKI